MKNNQLNSDSIDENEIDLIKIYRILLRNKFFILKFSLAILIVSCIFALMKKRVWEGQFEIVISQNNNNNISSNNIFQSFLDLDLQTSSSQSLNTEVGILNSPSVLMPIFNYVNDEKYKDKSKNTTFAKWQNKNLDVELKKKTSILNITYRDTDKELILPVLTKISLAYQEYSGKQKNRSFNLDTEYLKNQIDIYIKKSSLSKRIALEYAMDQNLSINDITTNSNNIFRSSGDTLEIESLEDLQEQYNLESFDFNTRGENESNYSLETRRINTTNQINKIDFQIAKLKDLTDIKDLQYMGSTMKPLVDQGLPQKLEEIESKLIELRSKYLENDISIKKLLREREVYTQLLKERALGYLKAKRIAYEANLESVKRPKGVIIRGKELMREADRDEETLVNLENNLRKLEVTFAKKEDPWNLITKPTIKEFPVAPNRKKLGLIGLIMGFFSGFGIAYVKERCSGYIYEEKDLENIFSLPIIQKLVYAEEDEQKKSTQIKSNELKNLLEKNLTFVVLDSELNKHEINKLNSYLSKTFTNQIQIISSSQDFNQINPKNSNILLSALGKLTFNDAIDFKKRAKILNMKLEGIILI